MDEHHAIEAIDTAALEALLNQYPEIIPEKLVTLEKQRLNVIPQAIKERDPAYITKDELATLMDWKLTHGKTRPTLQKLIQQNDEALVKLTTMECFMQYAAVTDKPPPEPVVKSAIALVSKLRGVGPATAALLLSEFDPENIPFFSDELYRWALWDVPAAPKGTGWTREIKYTVKEYLQLYAKVNQLRARLASASGKGVSALDIEKAAYVLGKQAQGPTATAKQPAKGKKRKATSKDDDDDEDNDDQGDGQFLAENNPAMAAFETNFEIGALGEDRVAQLDREEAKETAEDRKRDKAILENYRRAMRARSRPSEQEHDDVEEATGKKRKKQKGRAQEAGEQAAKEAT